MAQVAVSDQEPAALAVEQAVRVDVARAGVAGRRRAVAEGHPLAVAGGGLELGEALAQLARLPPLRRREVDQHRLAPAHRAGRRRPLERRVGRLGHVEGELLERQVDHAGVVVARHRARHRRGQHQRRHLLRREVHLGQAEALEVDHVAALLERVVLVGRDVADRHAELEQIGLVALERAQAGLDVGGLVRVELLADVAERHRRARAQQQHHEIEQPLGAVDARRRRRRAGPCAAALASSSARALPRGRRHPGCWPRCGRARHVSRLDATRPRPLAPLLDCTRPPAATGTRARASRPAEARFRVFVNLATIFFEPPIGLASYFAGSVAGRPVSLETTPDLYPRTRPAAIRTRREATTAPTPPAAASRGRARNFRRPAGCD